MCPTIENLQVEQEKGAVGSKSTQGPFLFLLVRQGKVAVKAAENIF